MIVGKAQAQPTSAIHQEQLRRLQKAIAVARCIRLAAEYDDSNDLDIADAVGGLLIVLECARLDAEAAP